VEINEQLPESRKIRVISISKDWTSSDKEYDLITEALQKARAAGMLVVWGSVELVYEGYAIDGLGRTPLADPDVFETYEPGWFYAKRVLRFLKRLLAGRRVPQIAYIYDKIEGFWAGHISASEGHIWVPMDARTMAGENGIDEYVFARNGGLSWSVPYVAGVYALAVQVDPAITPERFWALAAKTGRELRVEHEGTRRSVGSIIDPVRLIRSIEAGELANVKRSQSSVRSSSRSVLCVVPKGDFKPQTESELLGELNSQLSFTIPQKHFISRKKSGRLVGWAVVRNEKEKDVAKAELKRSATLKLIQVETLTPEFEAMMKQYRQ
jgi:hypothetical protein